MGIGKALLGALALVTLTACWSPSLRSGYRVEEGVVIHYSGFPAHATPVPDADARSFKSITYEYGKDKSRVFLNGKAIKDADPATFVYLQSAFTRDKKHAYWAGKVVTDDSAHFKIIPNPEERPDNVTASGVIYGRDLTRVYNRDMEVPGADPDSFEFVPMFNGYFLARDKNHVYEHGRNQPMEDLDGKMFKKISDIYFRDEKHVWGLSLGRDTRFEMMPLADPETFVSIAKFHGKDRAHVFAETKLLEGADPATFTIQKRP